jgi:hypothetical protein
MTSRFGVVVAFILFAAGPALGQVNIGVNFQTVQLSDSGFVPPDTNMAVGPGLLVQYDNGRIREFTKGGTQVGLNMTEPTFWGPFNSSTGIGAGLSSTVANGASGDPRILFDPLSGRWFVTAFTGQSSNNSLLIARSETADPTPIVGTQTWKAVFFPTNQNLFADYPTLGVDKNGVYMGSNNFTPNGPFQNVGIYSFPKADLLASTPSIANASIFPAQNANTYGYTLQGVTNFNLGQISSPASSTTAKLLGVDNQFANQAEITSLTGTSGAGATLGSPTVITITDPNNPPAAKQPNSGNTSTSTTTLDTIDRRFGSRVYQVGNIIYAVHGTIESSRAALIVEVINANTNAVITEATLGETNFDYYVASIAANPRGDVVVGYTRSGFVSNGNATNRWPSSFVSVGTLNGSSLSFNGPTELKTGVFYSAQGSGTNRWGDYSTTMTDPADMGIFWTSQEFGLASNQWATQATEIIPNVTGETRWKTAANGNYATAANWFNGALPASTDHVIYSRNGDGTTNYTVTLPAGTTNNDRVSVRQGVITFGIPSGSSYVLGNTGDGSTDSTPTNNPTSLASLAIADYLGTAKLTVSGGGTLQTVTTTIAARLNSEGTTGVSTGSLTVTGAGTSWANTGDVFVGGNKTGSGGTGTITIAGGATTNIGGTLKLWNNASAANVGSGTSAGTLIVNQLTNPPGTTPAITVTNNGSVFTLNAGGTPLYTGSIAVGGGGKFNGGGSIAGTATLAAGGTIQGGTGGATPADKLTLGGLQITGSGTIVTAFGGTHTTPTASLIELGSGTLSRTGGTTTILLSAAGTFDSGQQYTITIAHFGAMSGLTPSNPPPGGEFTISMTPIGFTFSGTPTLSYDNLTTPTQLRITFTPLLPVPEPGAVLAVSGLALAAGWQVRRRFAS